MSEKGGVAPWDASKYLNLYVCAIGGGILGYSSMPGSLAAFDGVVIDYRYFGTMGTAVSPFNLGRTTTHEIGHWLNLRHTWGDDDCGDDLISDTPVQQGPNYGCVTFPHITCSGDSKGDMFMNFMDYSDDACMYTGAGSAAWSRWDHAGADDPLLSGGSAPSADEESVFIRVSSRHGTEERGLVGPLRTAACRGHRDGAVDAAN